MPSYPTASILMKIIGNKTSRKIEIDIRYFTIIVLSPLFLRIKKTDNGKISAIASARTRQAKAKTPNDMYLNLKSFCRNRTKHDNSNKIKSGSVIPAREFSIILGWNTNSEAPKRDNSFPQNFLHRIKTGIIVVTEIIIVIYRCRSMYSKKFSELKKWKKTERKVGQPLFVSGLSGIVPETLKSLAYQK